MIEATVIEYQNGSGEIRYQPKAGNEGLFDGFWGGWLDLDETTPWQFSLCQPVLYRSRKSALRVAMRRVKKLQNDNINTWVKL